MATKPKSKTEPAAQWVHVPDVERAEPSAEITDASVIAFRNGLLKLSESVGFAKTIAGVMAYRAMLDLDHLARLLIAKELTSATTFRVVVKPKHAKDAKRFAAVAKRIAKQRK